MLPDLATEVAELEAIDTSTLTLRELVEFNGRMQQVSSRMAAMRLSAVSDLEESKAYEIDEARTPATWLVGHTGTSIGDARNQVRLAVHLRSMPATRAALAAAEITEAHARVLARGVENPRTAGQFAWDEKMLVLTATKVTADQMAEVMRGWTMRHDPDGTEPSDPADDVLHATRVGNRVKLDGDFGLETGIPLLAAINERNEQLYERDKRVAEENPDDGLRVRTPGNRRAEAVYELVMAGAGDESNPRRREPLFNVLIDELTLRTMEQRPDSIIELTDGTRLTVQLANMWGSDAMMNRVVFDARKALLSLGRTERYANREQRRALAARDRGCAVPGCDRPPEMCDAHHIVFWDDCGPTDIDNLVFLCRYHHRQVHRKRLRVEMVDGRPRFYDSFDQLIRPGRHRPSAQAA